MVIGGVNYFPVVQKGPKRGKIEFLWRDSGRTYPPQGIWKVSRKTDNFPTNGAHSANDHFQKGVATIIRVRVRVRWHPAASAGT